VDEGQPLPPPPPFAATAGLRQGVEDMQKFVKEYAAQSMIKKDAEYDVSISLQYLVPTTTLNVCDRCSRKSMMACVSNKKLRGTSSKPRLPTSRRILG
jgi:hypothetical protein